MGTRSTTTIVDEDGKTLVKFYRQYDGYPSGHGQELAKFLGGVDRLNGFSLGDRSLTPFYQYDFKKHRMQFHGPVESGNANGMGCLAAQLLTHFKLHTGIGGIYCIPVNDDQQEYNYLVAPDEEQGYHIICTDEKETLFAGSLPDFVTFCATYKS